MDILSYFDILKNFHLFNWKDDCKNMNKLTSVSRTSEMTTPFTNEAGWSENN